MAGGIAHNFNITIEQNIDFDTGNISIAPRQFEMIIENLCMNACEAIQGIRGTLGVSLKNSELTCDDILGESEIHPGHFIKITVSDTEHGMTPTVLEQIFDPFFTTKDVGEGDGIGLSMVYGVIKRHGGLIRVESEVGKGSTFIVFLPVVNNEMDFI